MFGKTQYAVPFLLIALLVIVMTPTAQGPVPEVATTITVTSTDDDYTDGLSKKCSDVNPWECTLRRAMPPAAPHSETPAAWNTQA